MGTAPAQRSQAKTTGHQTPYLHTHPVSKHRQARKESLYRSSGRAPTGPLDHLLHLQGRFSNRAVGHFLQAQLTVSQPDDPYEREADRVANTVMRMPEPAAPADAATPMQPTPLVARITPLVQREAQDEEEDIVATQPLIQSLPASALEDGAEEEAGEANMSVQIAAKALLGQPTGGRAQTPHVSPAVAANIQALEGGGSPLPQVTRAFFEPRFGVDFSQVRVHTDGRAAQTTSSINARAFTLGQNIAFGTGQYAPYSHAGRQVLAHELTHVVQQNGSQLQRAQLRVPGQVPQVVTALEPDTERKGGATISNKDRSATGVKSGELARRVLGQGAVLSRRPDGRGKSGQVRLHFLSTHQQGSYTDLSKQMTGTDSIHHDFNTLSKKRLPEDHHFTPGQGKTLQRTVGNQATRRLLNRDSQPAANTVGVVQRDNPPAAPPVARPSLAELRTIAITSINAEYYGAARDALTDFENAMTPDFDWGTFFVNQAGNMIWAVACFYTGSTAFLISTSGIALGATATAGSVSSRSDFHTQTVDGIDQKIIQPALNRVDAVTREVDSRAAANNWDDNQTRRTLLERLLRPEFIANHTGGVPAVNREAIRRQMLNDLITSANAYQPGASGVQDPGEFVYYYTVSNYIDEGGFLRRGELYASDHLKPATDWTFTLNRVALRLPQGGANATRVMSGTLHPARMPFRKRLSIVGASSSWHWVAVTTNAQNQFNFIGESYGIFEQIWPSHPARIGTHFSLGIPPSDTGNQILQKAWAANGGLPPDVTNPQPFSSYW
jgi:hypothetical protein